VMIDCFFYNDKDWQMEGTFKLRLPNDASPFYFAFGSSVLLNKNKEELPFVNYNQKQTIELTPDNIQQMRSTLWTNPKEARVVPKEKAALAYSQTVNKRVDPALMEWSGGGIFDCRVFPLLPKTMHRIVIGYEVNLISIKNDKVLDFSLPETKSTRIVDIDIANLSNCKSEVTPAFKAQMINNRKLIHIENPETKEISIRISNLKNCMLVNTNDEKEPYFSAFIKPDLPVNASVKVKENAVIMMDVSLSSNPDKFNVWLKLAEAILNNNRGQIKNFAVLFYNVEAFWWKPAFVTNDVSNVAALMEYCNSLLLEGATDMSVAVHEAANPKWQTIKAEKSIFILGDGNITWGESDVMQVLNGIDKSNTFYAFNTGMPESAQDILEQFTRETSGAIYSVTGEDEVNDASIAFRSIPWKIKSINVSNAKDILISGRPGTLYHGQNIHLAGRGMPSAGSSLIMELEQGGIKKTVKYAFSNRIVSDMPKRNYGVIATQMLEEFGFETEKYSIAYATHFGVAGKTCSFLMLDSEEDYKRYNIDQEENLYLINNNPVNEIIGKLMKEVYAALGDAKRTFTNWLNKLTQTPGFEFTIPTVFETLIGKMVSEDFSVKSTGLQCKYHIKSDFSEEITKVLAEKPLDYDNITANSQKLKQINVQDAMKLLSTLVEKNQGDGVLYRDIAFTAMEWQLYNQAYFILKNVLSRRPYEPQTYHAIAQVLVKLNKIDLAVLFYEIAIQAKWDQRFGEFRYIVAMDYMKLLRDIKLNKYKVKFGDYISSRLSALTNEFVTENPEMMITISWNTDFTDIDLHVTEPSGEECFYSHPNTDSGGRLTKDVTQGYGPEMYVLKKVEKGKYKITAHYFSSNRNRASARTKVYATVYQNWGKANEKITQKVVSLDDNKQSQEIMILQID